MTRPSDREIEATFVVRSGEVPSVAAALCRIEADSAGAFRVVRHRPARTVLHLYLAPGPTESIRRLRVKERRGALDARLTVKRDLSTGDLVTAREEQRVGGPLPLSEVLALVTAPRAVHSALVKNQYRLRLRQTTSAAPARAAAVEEFKVTLDEVLPVTPEEFGPGEPKFGPPMWHVEFEAVDDWDVAAFCASDHFARNLRPFVRPLDSSKWLLARRSPPCALPVGSTDALDRYLRRLLAAGSARRRDPLADPRD